MDDDRTSPLPDQARSAGAGEDRPENRPDPDRPTSERPTSGGPTSDRPTSGGAEPVFTDAAAPADPKRRRRRLIIGGVTAAAVLLVLLACLTAAAVVRSGVRLVDRADRDERRHERLTEACLELETRLNRLPLPGSTGGDPRRRAEAIRDENAALRPLLAELDEPAGDRGDRDRRHRRDRAWDRVAGDWRRLVEARTTYADALDRQSGAGEPAFFVAPRGDRDGAIVPELIHRGPQTCAGPLRRLAAPDL